MQNTRGTGGNVRNQYLSSLSDDDVDSDVNDARQRAASSTLQNSSGLAPRGIASFATRPHQGRNATLPAPMNAQARQATPVEGTATTMPGTPRPPLQRMDAAPGQTTFAHLLERPIAPGQEANAQIVERFICGQTGADNVMRVTSSCLNRLGNDWNAALACLRALGRCRHPRTGQGVIPSTITYNAAISACEKANRADKALELFKHLQTHGPALDVFPNTITYTAAISTCEKVSWTDQAAALFDHLLTHGPARNVFPDAITYSVAISAHGKAGRAKEALALFEHLQTHGPTRNVFPETITYNATISACEKAGWAYEAVQLFNRQTG